MQQNKLTFQAVSSCTCELKLLLSQGLYKENKMSTPNLESKSEIKKAREAVIVKDFCRPSNSLKIK